MAYLYFALAGINVCLAFMPSAPCFWLNIGAAVALFGYGLVETFKKGGKENG